LILLDRLSQSDVQIVSKARQIVRPEQFQNALDIQQSPAPA
jgi:hypothetical protein